MRVGLFIPCYIDQFYPDVGLATVDVLERLGVTVEFPMEQTCCGQPMANTGCTQDAVPLAKHFLRTFRDFDHIVAPSGSCVAMVRHHYRELIGDEPGYARLSERTRELCEFLVDDLEVQPQGVYPRLVGLHQSCHGLRELRLGSSSETRGPNFNKVHQVLAQLEGIRFAELQRVDECCGFGGTFAVAEESVSCMMGLDRIADHEQAGTEVLTAGDMSCLMHLDGLIRRQRKPIEVRHVAEILSTAMSASQQGSPADAAVTAASRKDA